MGKWFAAVALIALFLSFYWTFGRAGAELADNETMEIHEDNFILHIRTKQTDEGFEVLRAVQYTGNKTVEVKHQTPLVSVAMGQPNHDYTGSDVARTLNTGNSYQPQDPKTFDIPGEGTYTLYSKARFTAGSEEVTITHQIDLNFQ